jgi:dihydrofolate reductase
MGRKTWESIPEKFRPLPDRWNIVLSSQSHFLESLPSQVTGAMSLSEAIQTIENSHSPVTIIWMIGGSQVYQEALRLGIVDRVFVTLVHHDPAPQCNVFFPTLPPCSLDLTAIPEEFQGDFKEKDYSLTFQSFVIKHEQDSLE